MANVMIVGAGSGAMALIPILDQYKEIKLAGVADINRNAPALKIARKLGAKTSTCYKKLLSRVPVDVVINVTGSDEVSRELHAIKKNGMEIIDGASAMLLFKLVEERRQREEEAKSRLEEHKVLYDIGIVLTSSEREDALLKVLVDGATKVTNTPAGGMALYNEAEGLMQMAAARGFRHDVSKKIKWTVSKGSFTERVLNQRGVVVVNDTAQTPIEVPSLAVKGIKSLMAIPLIANKKAIGVLYVQDVTPREFSDKDEAIIALLTTQAATTLEKIRATEWTRRLAITDELTSLYNHRHFGNIYMDEMHRAARYNRSLSIMLIDIDNFKNYNDTHGHLKGNDVLKEVSEIMGKTVRDHDLLARYGGEEFSVILPETDKKKAYQCAERIRKAIERHQFYGENRQPLGTLTASIGVSTFPDDATCADTLLDRADIALYRAKDQGRNRVVNYESQLDIIFA